MIEIGIIIALVLAVGRWLKTRDWYPNSSIPAAIVILAVVFNLVNALLFGNLIGDDLLEAGRNGLIQGLGAIGIHSGVKNTMRLKNGE